jgi:hypothetical protein
MFSFMLSLFSLTSVNFFLSSTVSKAIEFEHPTEAKSDSFESAVRIRSTREEHRDTRPQKCEDTSEVDIEYAEFLFYLLFLFEF